MNANGATEGRATGGGTPEQRVSGLAAAMLRIGKSLDLETVLREVVEGARALTGAQCGVITTVDETGKAQDYVSSGLDEAADRQLLEWEDGPRLFAHLRDLPSPLRIADVHPFVRSLGFAAERLPAGAFQGTPMRHRDAHVGSFFLCGKEGGGAFTAEDEEVLILFAAQAAAAIANARAYRDERRARADLEALVDTCPVGVTVFDAQTGRPISVNQEMRRIMEPLRTPGRPGEELLESLTCRRADGREYALDRLPLAEELISAEPVRGEEILLSVPDGRSVTTLLNATPIPAEDGTVASVVVTMQDLSALQQLERMRAEFLGMVSHELRMPLTSIKGSTATVLGGSQNFAPAEIRQFFRIIDEQVDRMSGLIGDLLDAGRIETGTLSVSPEPTAVADLVDRARNTFLSGGARHTIEMDLAPDLAPVMADPQRILQVLNNLLTNAARHSPESSPIRVTAEREGAHLAVSVSDGGQGISPDRLPHLFRKYSGSAEQGRVGGLGLAICKGLVEAHGGRIRAESGGPGQGARFTFTLPLADAPVRSVASRTPGPVTTEPGARQRARILVVDDDPQTLRQVRDALAGAGYTPLVTGDHREVAEIVRTEQPVLVLLDLVLPGTDGIKVMESVPELSELPVVFLSGYGRGETVARALKAGAEDYIVKPFSGTELVARVQAALRRRMPPEPFVLGELAIDYDRRRVSVGGRPVVLTATEYELLRVLSLNAGRVSTYDSLLRQVWSRRGHTTPKIVRAFAKRLRAKLGDDARNPSWVLTERGVGYRMPSPDDH